MESKDIFVFGDSIVFGSFDDEKGGWVNRLRLKLEKLNKDKNSYVFNLGRPGDNSNDLVKRFDVECSIIAPKAENLIIIFGIGANDVKRMSDEKGREKVFEKNICTLITQAKRFTNKIAFVGLINVDENIRKAKGYSNEKIIKTDNLLRKICKKENVEYIYMYDVVNQEDLTDGLHPDSNGHQKIFERVFEKVSDM